ncbi:MAG: hypothetical protein MJE77_20595 [Proteobacteria bacterium]|nr:hypothetical protein [Pseudomonadota bacterium]
MTAAGRRAITRRRRLGVGYRRVLTLWLACVGLVGGPATGSAPAQPGGGELAGHDRPWFVGTSETQRERARQVFLEGNRLINVPNFRAAADKYKEAIAIWENPAFHYNLAIAQVNLLRPVQAYKSIERALRHGALPLGRGKHQRALDIKKTLERELAWIDVICAEAGARVALDGDDLFIAPGQERVLVRPGRYQLVATLDGRVPETRQITVRGGEEAQVELRLRFENKVVHRRRWPQWIPYAVAAGGALVAAGAGYLDHTSSQRFVEFERRFNQECEMNSGCRDGEYQSVLDSAERRQTGARVLYALGGVMFTTGVVLLFFNQKRAFEIRGERTQSVDVRPYVSREGAGMNAAFRF